VEGASGYRRRRALSDLSEVNSGHVVWPISDKGLQSMNLPLDFRPSAALAKRLECAAPRRFGLPHAPRAFTAQRSVHPLPASGLWTVDRGLWTDP
jgi:hypothetical protein